MAEEKETRDYIVIRKGLNGQSLGELEAQILDIVWELNRPVTTTDVFRVMYSRRPLSYSTIMLTMAKLAKKGILTQQLPWGLVLVHVALAAAVWAAVVAFVAALWRPPAWLGGGT